MEHPNGPNMPPMPAAGTDPSYIPGLTSPRRVEAEETDREPAVQAPEEDTAPEGAEAPVEEDFDAEVDGVVFDVSDRRGSITAHRIGVRFRLDDETAEFRWAEIGAVEIDTPWFGRRLTVTVYTTNRGKYQADVEASARSLPKQWAAELDAVLDAYFEDTKP